METLSAKANADWVTKPVANAWVVNAIDQSSILMHRNVF